jgi:hypothetical protein
MGQLLEGSGAPSASGASTASPTFGQVIGQSMQQGGSQQDPGIVQNGAQPVRSSQTFQRFMSDLLSSVGSGNYLGRLG